MKLANPLVTARRGDDAIAFLEAADPTPTLVLLDMHMPGTSGLDVLRWMRRSRMYDDVPAVVLAGSADLAAHANDVSPGPVSIDFSSREACVGDRPLDLSRKEFDQLACLASNPRRVFTRADLLREVWGSAPAHQLDTTVTEHVRRLRQKLGDDRRSPVGS